MVYIKKISRFNRRIMYFKMKKLLLSIFIAGAIVSCKKKDKDIQVETKEAYNKGIVNMAVESSIYPIADDLNNVFKSYYADANIDLKMQSQNEILNALKKDQIRLAIVPYDFTSKELEFFKGKVVPKVTTIAKDAILFVGTKDTNDTLINYTDVIKIFKGEINSNRIFVFHDANSAIVNKLKQDAGINDISKNVYYTKTVEEIVSYLNKNKNAVGVVGINWMVQPDQNIKDAIKGLKSLYVYNDSLKNYYKPSQSSIADKTYPLVRNINIIDVQGKTGLGTGFATFAASDKGQRLILKSGLMPVTMPKREINIVE